eukprot:COSAG01_NODE_48610_length_379_cov_1.450000_1_plen_31_part_01
MVRQGGAEGGGGGTLVGGTLAVDTLVGGGQG